MTTLRSSESAKIARDAGVAAIALHGRTAAQHLFG